MHETNGAQDTPEEETPAVAVIGMAGRFPGADDLDAFWDNLAAGRASVRPVTDEEFLAAGGDPRDLDDPSLIRMASVVEGIDRFDSGFFGYTPADAAVLDPQQRLLLETAYHALEDAGYGSRPVPTTAPSGCTRAAATAGTTRRTSTPATPGSPVPSSWCTRPPPTPWARWPRGSPTNWA